MATIVNFADYANQVAGALERLSRDLAILESRIEDMRTSLVALTVVTKMAHGWEDKEWSDFVTRCSAVIDQEMSKMRDRVFENPDNSP